MDLEWRAHWNAVGDCSHWSKNRVQRNASASDFWRSDRRRSCLREPLGFAGPARNSSTCSGLVEADEATMNAVASKKVLANAIPFTVDLLISRPQLLHEEVCH